MLHRLFSGFHNARETIALSSFLSRACLSFFVIELLLLAVILRDRYNRLPQTSIADLPLASQQSAAGYDPTKVAFMVETRPSARLSAVFLHFISMMPPEWTFHFVGSESSVAYMQTRPAIQQYEEIGRLRISLMPANSTVKDQETLSIFLTNLWLYESFLTPAENLLVFQTDSMMCSNSNLTVNDFLAYSWIGAPWGKHDWAPKNGGNGGFNLRRVSTLVDLLKKVKRTPYKNEGFEDTWLVHALNRLGLAQDVAEFEVGKTFSVEAINYRFPLGYHTGGGGSMLWSNVFGTPALREELFGYCPEIKMTLDADLAQFVPGNCNPTW